MTSPFQPGQILLLKNNFNFIMQFKEAGYSSTPQEPTSFCVEKQSCMFISQIDAKQIKMQWFKAKTLIYSIVFTKVSRTSYKFIGSVYAANVLR